jgi:Ubiquitin-conjugating enzyme
VDPRARRRDEDIRRLYALAAQYRGMLDVLEVGGQPPRRVRLRLAIPTARSAVFPVDRQAVSELVVELPEAYPLQEPRLTITTPVFNPNVYASGVVCHGMIWMPTEGLDLLVVRVMRLLALDPAIVNLRSAANGVAAAWYRMVIAQHPRAFPSVAIAAPRRAERPTVAWRAADDAVLAKQLVGCTGCGVKLRVDAGKSGTVACPRCGARVEVTA